MRRFALLAYLFLFCCNLRADGLETLAQSALEKYTGRWLLYPTHKAEVRGSKASEWDEYSLKSPNRDHFVLRKYYRNKNPNEHVYQIFQTDHHGAVVGKPSDDRLIEILKHNKIVSLSNYTKILESAEQYKNNNIKASFANVANSEGKAIGISITSFGHRVGHIIILNDVNESEVGKDELAKSALDRIDPNKIAYFSNLKIETMFQGRGLSYPLMCIAFLAAKEAYNKEYITLVDTTKGEVRGIYEKLGFKDLVGGYAGNKYSAMKDLYKYARVEDVLNSDRCHLIRRIPIEK